MNIVTTKITKGWKLDDWIIAIGSSVTFPTQLILTVYFIIEHRVFQ